MMTNIHINGIHLLLFRKRLYQYKNDNSMPSLLTLPIELVYRILDQLDPPTIIFSFRNVCIRFNAITDIYHRYKVK